MSPMPLQAPFQWDAGGVLTGKSSPEILQKFLQHLMRRNQVACLTTRRLAGGAALKLGRPGRLSGVGQARSSCSAGAPSSLATLLNRVSASGNQGHACSNRPLRHAGFEHCVHLEELYLSHSFTRQLMVYPAGVQVHSYSDTDTAVRLPAPVVSMTRKGPYIMPRAAL